MWETFLVMIEVGDLQDDFFLYRCFVIFIKQTYCTQIEHAQPKYKGPIEQNSFPQSPFLCSEKSLTETMASKCHRV